MKSDIILAGVGGQGIVSIAATVGMAALHEGLNLKQSEIHGMSQRGGDVTSHLRVSDKEIASDLIPYGSADIILSVEPMEALRYIPYLSKDGWVVTNSEPFINIPNYPDLNELHEKIKALPKYVLINADAIAAEVGSRRSSNIVMLGAASHFINIKIESLEEGIRQIFGRKGDKVVDANIKALHAGRNYVTDNYKF
jgi:indolepyruvate ferredoxin oxidoreductase beta subunit